MKKNLMILIILFSALFKAQNNIIVYDKIINETGASDKIYEKNVLIFDDVSSLFFSYRGELQDTKNFLNNNEKILSSQVIKNLYATNKFYIKDNSFSRDIIFAIDDYQDFNWKIIPSEEVKILGYKCSKAIGVFRGREYEAWFTRDLAADVGPWKFRSLPGAILKIVDKNKMFTFEASMIVLNFPLENDIYKKLTFEFPTNISNYVDYQQYVRRENEYLRETVQRVKANRPIGTIVISTSKDRDFKLEKSFEWEDVETKK